MDYLNSQTKYMEDVHISDANRCEHEWKVSLYEPLRDHLSLNLKKQNIEKDTFVYIGSGPLAPIIEIDTECFDQINKFAKIVILDISEPYLFQAKTKIKALFPNKEIESHVYDITNGLSDIFYKLVMSLLTGDSSAYLPKIQYLEENIENILNGLNPFKCRLPIYGANFVYSELVATYTGIPALFDFEEKLNQHITNDKELINRVLGIWQIYNERVYQHHVTELSEMVGCKGVFSVATDIEKIYINNNLDNISSFLNPSFVGLTNFHNLNRIYIDEKTLWDDSGNHKYDKSTHVNTLAHLHKVGFYTYERM